MLNESSILHCFSFKLQGKMWEINSVEPTPWECNGGWSLEYHVGI